MAVTSSISTNELLRVHNAAYANKFIQAGLANDATFTATNEDPVSTWENYELVVGTNGYTRASKVISGATGNTTTIDVSYNYIDFEFTANGGPLSYNRIFLIIGSLVNSVNITTTSRTSNVATINTSAPHNLIATDLVYLANTTAGTFNGFFDVLSTPTATSFTISSVGDNKTLGADTGTATTTSLETNLYGSLTETPSIVLANTQTQTYRLILSLDN